jgi:hypothetical protein
MEIVMRATLAAKLAIVAIGVVVMAGGADAQPRIGAQGHLRHPPRLYQRTYQYAPRGAPQYRSPRSSGDIYQSDAQGRQPYPNPDRDFSGPNPGTYGG